MKKYNKPCITNMNEIKNVAVPPVGVAFAAGMAYALMKDDKITNGVHLKPLPSCT